MEQPTGQMLLLHEPNPTMSASDSVGCVRPRVIGASSPAGLVGPVIDPRRDRYPTGQPRYRPQPVASPLGSGEGTGRGNLCPNPQFESLI